MKEKYKKYLPIGSVVLLENTSQRVMITGFCVKSKQKEMSVYDYIGCLYPDGVFSTKNNLLFNHDKIQKIFAIGYSDEEEKKFKEKLETILTQIENK